jgi:hypothetical protein
MKINALHIERIGKQIEVSVNRSITGFPDAVWLSDIFKDKRLSISPSTLARLYGIVSSASKPYLSTLDTLARFLEYENWENYVEDQSRYHFNANFFLNEDTHGFSQSVLELALQLKRFDTVQTLLEKYTYFDQNPIHFATANLIGNYVKHHNYNEELLSALANTKAGRSLFFECFVDENNENNAFSNALLKHYLPKVSNKQDIFFVYAYVLAQNAYASINDPSIVLKYKEILKTIPVHELHFHLLSRYLECEIHLAALENKLHRSMATIIEAITEHAYFQTKNEWILARTSKALLHYGYKDRLFKHPQFNEMVNTVLMKKRKSKNSAALYIIQLYWLYSKWNEGLSYHPFHLAVDYIQGNSKERIAIESATARFYAKGKLKGVIEENLKVYCQETNIKWILNLIGD